MERKPGRPKIGENTLSRERILTTALSIVDAEGIDGLSMRRLAGKLGVDPMAIYHHLPNKKALIQGVIETVFEKLTVVPADDKDWQERIRATAHAYISTMKAHPNLIIYLVTDVEWSADAALRVGEVLYAALLEAGLSPRRVVQAADLIADYLNGYALGERSGYVGKPGERGEFIKTLRERPDNQFPALRHVFEHIDEDEILSSFDAGLDFILAGVKLFAQQLERD